MTHLDETKQEVIVAYHEAMNKLKVMKGGNDAEEDQITQEMHVIQEEKNNIIALALKETPEEVFKKITDLKSFISKILDDIKGKLLAESEKFHTLNKAIEFSRNEIEELYEIKAQADSVSILLAAQREKSEEFERELRERKENYKKELIESEKMRRREEEEYINKRDSHRRKEQEQYDKMKRELLQELSIKRTEFEEEMQNRETDILAKEQEYFQLKEREARNIAIERDFELYKQKCLRFPDELRNAVKKAELTITDQLTRQHEYDLKLMQIEWESEKKQYEQKIDALAQQIEQYKSLKQFFED
jgi:hypothetical protein